MANPSLFSNECRSLPKYVSLTLRVFGDELYICMKYFSQDIDSENNGLNTLFTTAAQQHNKNFS
uniref:Uncharacterized protein n=1 Tax=Oryza rufipogon TaxID=4529 RepID=A0A0E0PAR3_ORYRU